MNKHNSLLLILFLSLSIVTTPLFSQSPDIEKNDSQSVNKAKKQPPPVKSKQKKNNGKGLTAKPNYL